MSVARADMSRKIPDQLRSTSVTLVRPILGAAAAIVVMALFKVGTVTLVGPSPWPLAAVAFFAGFSERWFLDIVGKASERVNGGAK